MKEKLVNILILISLSYIAYVGLQYQQAQQQLRDEYREQRAREPSLSYQNLPFKTESPVYHPGDVVYFTVVRCSSWPVARNYNTSKNLVRTDIHQDPILLGGNTVEIEPGCTPSRSALNILPIKMPCGEYVLQGLAEVNDEKTYYVPWYTTQFSVRDEGNGNCKR